MKYVLINGIQSECYLATEDGEIFNKEGHKLKKHRTVNGYDRVRLNRDIPRGMYSVHRIIAETYIPNPANRPVVNHKDNVRHHNWKDNLEWATNSENQLQRFKSGHKGTKRVPIEQVDVVSGDVVAEWGSAVDAEQATGIARQNISKVCRGLRHTAGGYYWKYK